jgi:hypothetical protein
VVGDVGQDAAISESKIKAVAPPAGKAIVCTSLFSEVAGIGGETSGAAEAASS